MYVYAYVYVYVYVYVYAYAYSHASLHVYVHASVYGPTIALQESITLSERHARPQISLSQERFALARVFFGTMRTLVFLVQVRLADQQTKDTILTACVLLQSKRPGNQREHGA